MRKYNQYEITKAHYNNFSTTFIVQCTISLIIILSIWVLRYFRPDMLEQIAVLIRQNIAWEQILSLIAEIKDILLHYIR